MNELVGKEIRLFMCEFSSSSLSIKASLITKPVQGYTTWGLCSARMGYCALTWSVRECCFNPFQSLISVSRNQENGIRVLISYVFWYRINQIPLPHSMVLWYYKRQVNVRQATHQSTLQATYVLYRKDSPSTLLFKHITYNMKSVYNRP